MRKYKLIILFFWLGIYNSLSLNVIKIKKESGIYCIENTITKSKYIGQAGNPFIRKQAHISKLRGGRHPNRKLTLDYKKYGEKAFIFYTLVSCEPKRRLELEKFYIKYYNAYYNDILTWDGDGLGGASSRTGKASKERWKVPGYKEKVIAGSIKAVEQLDLKTGAIIKEYSSGTEAAKQNNTTRENITHCCKGDAFTAIGYRWRYKGEVEKGTHKIREKAVIALDKITLEEIKEYPSLKEAVSQLGGKSSGCLIGCIKGEKKSFKGFKWKYKTYIS